MALKSILQIPVDDAEFKEFVALFEKHRKAVSQLPAEWKKITEAASSSVEAAAAVELALQEQLSKKTDEVRKSSEKIESYWKSLAKSSKTFSSNIKNATVSLLKWASIGGIISGLTGIGGLFGIDRMAASVASNRQRALGLGTSYGGAAAFRLNFGHVVSPSFLENINTSLHDQTQRYKLYGMGLTEQDLASGDSAQVAAIALRRIKDLLDKNPASQIGQVLAGRNIPLSIEEATGLRGIKSSYLNTLEQGFKHDTSGGALSLSQDTQQKWDQFNRQLSRAGQEIETVFVQGLTGLTGPLKDLSASVTDATRTLLKNLGKNHLIDKIGVGIEKFAHYVGGSDFQTDIAKLAVNLNIFANDVVALAGRFHNILVDVGIVPGAASSNPVVNFADRIRKENPSLDSPTIGERISGVIGWLGGNQFLKNNIGNLRPVGATHGFRKFTSLSAGVNALASDLRYKENHRGLDTISKIIHRYAPANENDTENYINYVSKRLGIGSTSHIDLNNKKTLAQLISAISKMEGRNPQTPEVVLKILNNTGGSAVVAASQVGVQ